MKIKRLLISILIFASIQTTSATIINVPGDYSTIQFAIEAASDGDTVLVAPGAYLENINFLGKNILVSSHYMLNNDVSFILNTKIIGSQPNHPDTASCVLFINGETRDAILQGFTLTGGSGTRWQDIHIGGFYREGGGILIELSSPTIQFNLIEFNDASDKTNCTSAGGGGIRCGDGDPLIQNNVIANNQALYGAGIVMNFASGTIRNNLIIQNSGGIDFGGAGIWSYSASETIIENNTIINNHSELDGGGILIWSTSAKIKNNIIRSNTAVTIGDQLRLRPGGSAEVTYSNIEEGWAGEGNIDVHPDWKDFRYILADNSPGVDEGDPDTLYNDPEGTPGMALWPAKGTIRNDMGAHGGSNSAELSGYTIVSVNNDVDEPKAFYLAQNYPNPFNPITKIKFTIPSVTLRQAQSDKLSVTIKVFDLLGNEIATLVNEEKYAGDYEVEFDTKNLTSGIYFYKLVAGSFAQTKKMILIK